MDSMLKLHAARINPTIDPVTLDVGLKEFMQKIQQDAFKDHKTMQNDVNAMAEYLWTSSQTHALFLNMELSSLLNAIIRDDVEEEIEAAIPVFRSINSRRISRVSVGDKAVDTTFPRNGETWRGGSFRTKFQSFFTVGIKYRVPGFLATTCKKAIAAKFASVCSKEHPRALWRIVFDPRGKHQAEYRVNHMTFVTNTLFRGEGEYLFAPYSVFTLVSVEWSEELRKPHDFVIQAAIDNKREEENLPLAPWY